MQRPTLDNVRIRSTRDALHVFHGVARNVLPLITRRLDADERRAIVAGNVYVWEERNVSTENIGVGMERWTDGMGWGPSRVRDEFLFYHQKESDVEDDPLNPVTPLTLLLRKREASSRNSRNGSPHMQEPERLIKQTYSVHVSLPADRARGMVRKWHLTAYFSQERLDSLKTIDTVRGVGDIPVPDGLFRSARASKTQKREIGEMTSSNTQMAMQNTFRPTISTVSSPSSPVNRTAPSQHVPQSPTHAFQTHSIPSSPSPRPGYRQSHHGGGQLVPLEYLQNVAAPKRHPADEQLLRRFSSTGHRNTSAFASYHNSAA
ncbi:Gti1/Pac2 family-domain-containing protein [Mycena floridula]|nr:Gti1/Pac2 family-domain-containing protein [Mycena floridula]